MCQYRVLSSFGSSCSTCSTNSTIDVFTAAISGASIGGSRHTGDGIWEKRNKEKKKKKKRKEKKEKNKKKEGNEKGKEWKGVETRLDAQK